MEQNGGMRVSGSSMRRKGSVWVGSPGRTRPKRRAASWSAIVPNVKWYPSPGPTASTCATVPLNRSTKDTESALIEASESVTLELFGRWVSSRSGKARRRRAIGILAWSFSLWGCAMWSPSSSGTYQCRVTEALVRGFVILCGQEVRKASSIH